jgi:hypothetical protein
MRGGSGAGPLEGVAAGLAPRQAAHVLRSVGASGLPQKGHVRLDDGAPGADTDEAGSVSSSGPLLEEM